MAGRGLWRLRLLGSFGLWRGEVAIPLAPGGLQQRLLAMLALAGGAAVEREALAARLWPTASSREARRANLRRELNRLNDKLHLHRPAHDVRPIIDSAHTLALDTALVEVDLLRLRAHVVNGQWREARALAGYGVRLDFDAALAAALGDGLRHERKALAAARAAIASGLAGPTVGTQPGTAGLEGIQAGPDGAAAPAAAQRRSAFFGREAELDAVTALVQHVRVVTIRGAPGVGKARLAERVRETVAGFEVNARVRCRECDGPGRLAEQILAALGARHGQGSAEQQVHELLREKRSLLVLTGFEPLAGAQAAGLLARLSRRLPLLRLLVSSRCAVGLAGEAVFDLRALPLPGASPGPLTALASQAAVALFVARAKAVYSPFALTARNRGAVVAIVQLLDGVPLVIEWAASHIRDLRPRALLASLVQCPTLCGTYAAADLPSWQGANRSDTRRYREDLQRGHGGKGAAHKCCIASNTALEGGMLLAARRPRSSRLASHHLSLEAAMAWSWQRLEPAQRVMLSNLTAFADGWSPAQAVEVAGDGQAGDDLARLVQHSLVEETTTPVGVRQRLFGVVLQHALASATAAQQQRARARHRRLFVALSVAADRARAWPELADVPNIERALRTAIDDGAVDEATAIVDAMACAWRLGVVPIGVLDAVQVLANDAGLPLLRRARLHGLVNTLLLHRLDARTARASVDAIAAIAALAPGQPLVAALADLAHAEWWRRADGGDAGRPAARERARRARDALSAGIGDARESAYLLGRASLFFAACSHEPGGSDPFAEAATEAAFEAAEAYFAGCGDARYAAQAAPGLTARLLWQGRFAVVVQRAKAALAVARRQGDVVTEMQLYDRLSNAYLGTGQPDLAIAACRTQCGLARDRGLAMFASYGAWNQCEALLALLPPRDCDAELAIVLLAFSRRIWSDGAARINLRDERYGQRIRAAAAERLGAARAGDLWRGGLRLPLARGMALATGDETWPGRS